MSTRIHWIPPIRRLLGTSLIARWALILVSLTLEIGWLGAGVSAVGYPLYPDLITLPPSGLYVERSPDGHYLLRFANTAANLGGRLEIAVGAGTRDLYQNVYDQYSGGSLVVHQKVGADLIYHPQHNHFHFQGFAKYELLKRDSAGYYRTTARTGSKTTFCILDSVRVSTDGPTIRQFDTCGDKVQGMSAGWGDVYIASLFGQWIDLGSVMLPDGAYAIRSTADPENKLTELSDFNNVGHTYFKVLNGRISTNAAPPLCGVEPVGISTQASGGRDDVRVGSTVEVTCLRFGADEPVDIYWGSVNSTAKATVTSTSGGAVFAQITVPKSSIGVHYVIARGRTSGTQVASVVNVVPAVQANPVRSVVSGAVTYSLSGFSASELVTLRVYKSDSVAIELGSTTVATNGSGLLVSPLPAMPYGGHRVEAIGGSSGAVALSSLVVMPSVTIAPDTVEAGEQAGVALRGFAAGERVSLQLGSGGQVLATLTASHSGSTSSRTTVVQIPDSVAPGTYPVIAMGATTGASASFELTVAAPAPSEAPVPTPLIEASPIESPVSSPEPSATPPPAGETPSPAANAPPIAIAPVDMTLTDMDGNGSERMLLSGRASFDPDGGALSWEWSISTTKDDGTTTKDILSTEAMADITLPVGVHQIDLVVTDSAGLTATDAVVVTIEPPPPELWGTPVI